MRSWRGERATDFRRVQGAVNANGAGGLLSGIAGTPPAGAYEGATVPIVSFTGVAVRSAGYAMGAILIALAFLPKVSALLLAIPDWLCTTRALCTKTSIPAPIVCPASK